MKKLITLLVLTGASTLTFAQSETTREFSEKHEDAFTLFFYNNTLKMLNQDDNAEFDALIKDIDKMKFIRISKVESKFTDGDLKRMIAAYHNDNFEDLMTIQHQGMNINVYIQEDEGVTTGLILLMNEAESFSILDIEGKVPLDQLANLIAKVQEID